MNIEGDYSFKGKLVIDEVDPRLGTLSLPRRGDLARASGVEHHATLRAPALPHAARTSPCPRTSAWSRPEEGRRHVMRSIASPGAGFTLVELLLTVTLVSMLFVMTWHVFLSGPPHPGEHETQDGGHPGEPRLLRVDAPRPRVLRVVLRRRRSGQPTIPRDARAVSAGSHHITMGRGRRRAGAVRHSRTARRSTPPTPKGGDSPGGLFIGRRQHALRGP